MTNQKKSVLGRGLSALIPKTPVSTRQGEVGEDSGGVNVIASVELERIRPNPFQPRTDFDSESLEELSKSILEKGLIQPITVRRLGEDYQLVSGERRMRAAQRAGLPSIPAFIIDVQSDSEMLELALVENIQREELNPIEIAHAYRRLIDECRLTQDEVGQKVGKDRSTVTNSRRLLKLPEKVREGLRRGRLSTGHARALLGLDNERDQLRLYDEIVMGGVNVRSVERTTRARKAKPAKHTRHGTGIHSVEEQLKRMLGTKVKVYAKSGGKGEIVIQYFSADDLERILELILDKRHR